MAEREVSKSLNELLSIESNFVAILQLPNGLNSSQESFNLNLAQFCCFSPTIRVGVVDAILDRLEDSLTDQWDQFVVQTGGLGGGMADLLSAVFKGVGDWRTEQIERRVRIWVTNTMPTWLRTNKARIATRVAEALLASVYHRLNASQNRIISELSHIESSLELALSGSTPEIMATKAARAAQVFDSLATIDAFVKRSRWIAESNLNSIAIAPGE
eukprot:c2405_g1_i1.p1 GENE.c2405_g1_i1~~c2405_g1_i1.p1  ORF type:complete len:215 (-),score=39.89 c2405_g1_i1:516-1160(-)